MFSPSCARSTGVRRSIVGVALVVALSAPIALATGTASAASMVACDHPGVLVSAKPTLGVPDKKGAPRHATLKIRAKVGDDQFCSSPFTLVKRGVARTIERASLKIVLKRSTNQCASLTAPAAGAPWTGKATLKYYDEDGRRIATSRRTGTFFVIDTVTRFEGPGLVRITGTPTSAPITGPFTGTFLELNVTYDPPSLSPYTACTSGGWQGLPAPTFTYWHEA
jgi:hypothetical protein